MKRLSRQKTVTQKTSSLQKGQHVTTQTFEMLDKSLT